MTKNIPLILYSKWLWKVTKGLRVRGELETEQTATYWPPPRSLPFAALLFCSAGLLNWRSWGPMALCWVLVLSTASYLQLTGSKLTEPVSSTGLYNCLTSTCLLWVSHLHPVQSVHSQGYNLISSMGGTCYLHRCISLFDSSARVNILQYII